MALNTDTTPNHRPIEHQKVRLYAIYAHENFYQTCHFWKFSHFWAGSSENHVNMIISLPTSFKAFTKISFHDLHGQGKPRTSLGMDGRLDLSKPYGVLFLTPHLKIDHNVNFLRVKSEYKGWSTL